MSFADTTLQQTSQVELVFRRLLVMIIDGTYPEKSRLPAERTLCEMLDTSRGTLREALRRLSDWNVTEAKQGSGITVRPKKDWLFDVMPTYLTYLTSTMKAQDLVPLFTELMDAQREVFLMALRIAARRADPDKLHDALALAHDALNHKDDPLAFSRADFAAISALIEAGDFMPLQWLMNRISGVFAELVMTFGAFVPAPDGYIAYYEKLVALMAAHDEDAVVAHADAYLKQIDADVLAALEPLFAQQEA